MVKVPGVKLRNGTLSNSRLKMAKKISDDEEPVRVTSLVPGVESSRLRNDLELDQAYQVCYCDAYDRSSTKWFQLIVNLHDCKAAPTDDFVKDGDGHRSCSFAGDSRLIRRELGLIRTCILLIRRSSPQNCKIWSRRHLLRNRLLRHHCQRVVCGVFFFFFFFFFFFYLSVWLPVFPCEIWSQTFTTESDFVESNPSDQRLWISSAEKGKR